MDAAPEYLTDPVKALSRSEHLEAALLSASDGALAAFLGKVVEDAASGNLTRGSVVGSWMSSLTAALIHPTFADLRPDLLAALSNLSFADDTYSAAQMALETAHNMGATPEERLALLTALFAHPDEKPGLVASLSAKVDSWLRRRISKQILARLGASGPDSLTEANFPEYPAAPHPTATLVTESDWSNDDRPGDINWRARMQRDIRTGYTYVYGRQVQKQIEKFGFTEKRWVSRHDERVRHTHMEANGQTVPVHSQFTVGGSRLSFPGDPLGPYEEIVNCRCVPVAVAR